MGSAPARRLVGAAGDQTQLATVALGKHLACCRAREQKRTFEVGVQHEVPFVLGHVDHGCVGVDRGVVDRDVQAAMGVDRALNRLVKGRRVAHVGLNGQHLAASVAQLGGGALQFVGVIVESRDAVAVAGEASGNAAADAVGSAGDEHTANHWGMVEEQQGKPMPDASKTFNFGPGNPDPGVFPSRDLGAAAQRVLARDGAELAHYPDPLGLPALRNVAVDRLERNFGTRPPLADVVITNGAMQGLQLSAQGLARPGDTVVLEEFEYSGTIRVFKQFGLELLGVPLDEHGMRMDALAEVLARQHQLGKLPSFIYTTASYQNPTGTTLPVERRLRLIELARQYGVPIVEDDTYGDISFEPQAERAVYALARPGEVMYIGSFSKILGPGLRLGFFVAPPSIAGRLTPWKTDGGTSALAQMVAAEYFSTNLWEHVEEGRSAVKEKRNTLMDALETEFGNVDGMRWTKPDGGLFVWVKLPEEVDRARIAELAAAGNITYATGQAFHAHNQDVPYLRLAFGWIDREDIPEGVHLLADCIRAATPARSATG